MFYPQKLDKSKIVLLVNILNVKCLSGENTIPISFTDFITGEFYLESEIWQPKKTSRISSSISLFNVME